MKATKTAGADLKSASDTVLPSVSGRRKSGAFVPSSTMVEGVSAIVITSGANRKERAARPATTPGPLIDLRRGERGVNAAARSRAPRGTPLVSRDQGLAHTAGRRSP